MAELSTEADPVPADLVLEQLTEQAARLRTREVEAAPEELVRRRMLAVGTDSTHHFTVELMRRWIGEKKPLGEVKDEIDRLDPVAERHFMEGKKRVLGWSFYSQGTDSTAASSDAFVDFALRWLKNEEEVPGSPWERGVLVARLVRAQRTLLVLDGLEPLQHPPGTLTGRLKDPAVAALLRELSIQNPGLCVVTTRLAVDDLAGRAGAVSVNL